MHLRPRLQQSYNSNTDQIPFHMKQQNKNSVGFSKEKIQSQRIKNSYLQQNNNYIKVDQDEGRNGGRNNSYQNKIDSNGLNQILYPDNNTSSWSVNQMNQISSGQNTGQFGNGSMLNSNGRGSNNSYIINQQNDNISKENIPRALQNNYNTINYDDSIQNLQGIQFQNQNQKINWQTLQNQNMKPISAQIQQFINAKAQSSQRPLNSKEIQKQRSQDQNRLQSKESQNTNKIKSIAKTGRFISNNPKNVDETNFPKQQFFYNNPRPIIPKYLGSTLLKNQELNKGANKNEIESTSLRKSKELNNNLQGIPIQIFNQNTIQKYQGDNLYDLPRQMNLRNTSNDESNLKNKDMINNEQKAILQQPKNNLQRSHDKLEQQKLTQKYYLDLYYKEKFNQNIKNKEDRSNLQNMAQIDFIKQKLNFDKNMNDQQLSKLIDQYKQFQNDKNYPKINQLVQNQDKSNQFQNHNEFKNETKENKDQQANKSSSSEDSDLGMQQMLNQIKQEVLQLKIQKGLIPDTQNSQNQITYQQDPKTYQMSSQLQFQIQSNPLNKIQNLNQIPIQHQKVSEITIQPQKFNQNLLTQEYQILKNEVNATDNQFKLAKQNEQKKSLSPDINQHNEKYPQNSKQIQKSNQKLEEFDLKNEINIQQINTNQNKEEQKSQIQIKNEGMSNRQKLKIMEEHKEQAKEEEKLDKRRIQTSPLTRQLSQKDENQISQIKGVYLQKNKSNNNFVIQEKNIEQEEKDFLYLNIPASNKSDAEEISERNEPSSQNQQRIFQNSPLSSKKQLDGQSQSSSAQSRSKSSSDNPNVFPTYQNHSQMLQTDMLLQRNIEQEKLELNSRQRANSNIIASNLLNSQDQLVEQALNLDQVNFDNQQFIIHNQIVKMDHFPPESFKLNMAQKEEFKNQNKKDFDQIIERNQYQNRNSKPYFEEQQIEERKQFVDNIMKSSLIGDQTSYEIKENNGQIINSESQKSISISQKTCNNSSIKLNNDISQLMNEKKMSSVKKIDNNLSKKSVHLDDIILNEQSFQSNQNFLNNEIFFEMLELKLYNQWIKKQKTITHDQNLQTDPVVQMQKQQQFSKEIQTENSKQNKMQLSPFETYDLLFVKDLVNNLNQDNEILYDNASDLKAAFLFLHQEHKNLQFKYQQEKRNSCFVDLQKERIKQITNERDKALEIGMKLRDKIEIMTDIMKIAVEQQNIQNTEQDQAVQQLQEENKQLRQLLQIHRSIQSEEFSTLKENEFQENKNQKVDSSLEQDNNKNLTVEESIENGLLQYEQELRRNQDDYLIFLKEEQDRQFNQEIDEHKEILSGIYDQKLIQKTQEIEEQLLDTLTQQITESLTSNIQQQMTGIIRNQLREEVKQEVRSLLIEEVTLEIQNKFKNDYNHQSSQISDNQHIKSNNEIKQDDLFESGNQINKNNQNQSLLVKLENDNEQNKLFKLDFAFQKNASEQNISSESDSPFHLQHQFHSNQQIVNDKINDFEMNNQNNLDFKLLLEDQPMTQEEQELLQQLFQREERAISINQEEEKVSVDSEMQYHQIDNDETQKFIFQEINRQEIVQRNILANTEQERRNHNQSQGFQGQHVFNNFQFNQNIVDQVSNESFQGQSRGSQRFESIFHNDSSNYNSIQLQTNIQTNDYDVDFKSVQGFQGQSSAQFHHSHQQDEQQQETQNVQNINQDIQDSNVNFEEFISYDYQDFLQGLQQTNQQIFSYQQTQNNDQPFELANQEGDNFNNQLNNDQQEYNFKQLSRSIESIDFLGDQLEKDLFTSQENIQAPINFLMDDGELISDIFKVKQQNNINQFQISRQKFDFEQNVFDSTNGIRSMLAHLKKNKNVDQIEKEEEENSEREENKEEEYDYFLDAQQDENLLNNNGYHIIDQAELDQSESKDKEGKSQTNKHNGGLNNEYDEDLEHIEDEELREYRYRNMLEDLKESIQSEDEEANRKKNHE